MQDLPTIDDPWIGKLLDDRFEVCALLGKGGMGAIYRCREVTTDLQVALKITLEELQTDEEVMARFEREIHASKDIVHPNVVRVLGHGRTGSGTPYFAMELLPGKTLDEVLEDAPLSSEKVAHIGAQIARGLHAAHLLGIIHRDLKPENVVMDRLGQVKVFDFGLSILRRPGQSDAPRLTEMDLRIGTPMYMSPEYIENGDVDARSDLYSLGVLLYEAATGYLPHTGAPYQVMHKHATVAPKPIEDRVPGAHPQWLIDVIHQLLSKLPSDRPQTGADTAALLTRPPASVPRGSSLPPSTLPKAIVTATPKPAPAPQTTPANSLIPRLWQPLILVAALVWFGLAVGLAAGKPSPQDPAHNFAPAYYGATVALAGEIAYDMGPVSKAAKGDGQRVQRTFQPPTSLALLAWAPGLDRQSAWGTWLVIQNTLLLFALFEWTQQWKKLGNSLFLSAGVLLAAANFIPSGLVSGTPLVAPFAAAVVALGTRSAPVRAGALGVAVALSPVHLVIGVFWAAQQRWKEVAVASLTAGVLTVGAGSVVGLQNVQAYITQVVPSMLRGNYLGLGLRFDALSNHSLAHWLSLAFPGTTGQNLSTIGWVGVSGSAVVFVSAALWQTRIPTTDPWTLAFRSALTLATVGLIGPYFLESHLIWCLPAMILCGAAVAVGRSSSNTAIALGIALAVLCFPDAQLRNFQLAVAVPALPILAPVLQSAKLAAVLGVWLTTLSMSGSPDPTVPG